MNFRNYADLDATIRNNLRLLPRDIDLVVGIPRSGLMAASIIALYLNVPLGDVDGLLSGRVIGAGRRMREVNLDAIIDKARKILVVDDSCCSGLEIARNKNLLSATGLAERCLFAAVYVTPEAVQILDLYFEICPMPRMFAWNLMHHSNLERACVDIDGVLCVDPTPQQNDDGENYRHFLRNTRPLYLPSVKVGALITCRLERYRSDTVEWLDRHGVMYDELIMWDLPSKEERIKKGGHGIFKGNAYKERQWADVFIESSLVQAVDIGNVACKPVICIENQSMVNPQLMSLIMNATRKTPKVITARMNNYLGRVKAFLQKRTRY